jgi:branched-chain amino acid transport system substrate-binding protein
MRIPKLLVTLFLAASGSLFGSASFGADDYKLGMLHSFSGYLSPMAAAARDGFQLGVEEVNKRAGANERKLGFVVASDESDASKGVTAAVRLMTSEKVLSIVGPVRSDVAEAMAPLLEKNQVVNMTNSFMLPTTSKYTFTTVPPPDEEARVMTTYMKKQGAKTLSIINSIDLYSKTLTRALTVEAERQGIKVLGNESFNPTVDKSFIPQLSKLKSGNPEWLAVLGGGAPLPVIMKQKGEISFNAKVIGGLGFTTAGVAALIEIGGAAVEGTHYVTLPITVWDSLPKDHPKLKAIMQYREVYKAKHGQYPDTTQWWTSQNYDIAMLLAEALRRAGPSATGAMVKTALEGIKDFQGVAGTYTFSDTQHAGATGLVVAEIRQGKIGLAK